MLLRCISDDYYAYPAKGEIYEVEKQVGGAYYIRDEDGDLYGYPVIFFELVEE